MVAGIVAISAVRNVPPVAGESHFRRLRRAQLRLIAIRAASLAGLQILSARVLRKIGRLRECQKRPETKTETGYRGPKTLPQSHVHGVRLLEDSSPRCRGGGCKRLCDATGTGLWFRSRHKALLLTAFQCK